MMNMYLLDISPAAQVCDMIESKGYRAYCVGGCVRDVIRGEEPHDFDITTSALPVEIINIFESIGCTVIKTGIAHGTVTVHFDGREFEITTMRCEGSYADHRHPDSVSFVDDIMLDLGRRDFTVNAIAYSFSERRLIDPFNGVSDINGRCLRCVGDPYARFSEDALRILRGLRFSAVLGFEIEDATLCAMREKKELIAILSPERIYCELIKTLCGEGAGSILYEYYDIFSVIIPQLSDCHRFDQRSSYHCYDILQHICNVIDSIPAEVHLRLAALFHDIGKPSCFSMDDNGSGHFYGHAAISAQIAENALRGLRADRDTIDKVLFLVRHHDTPIPNDEVLIKKRLSKYGKERFFDLVHLAVADCRAQSEKVQYRLALYDEIKNIASDILNRVDCISVSCMEINGRDIIKLGVGEGKAVGIVLDHLFNLILANDIENNHYALIEAAKKIIVEMDLG